MAKPFPFYLSKASISAILYLSNPLSQQSSISASLYLGKASISAKPLYQQSLYLSEASISAKPLSQRSLFFTFLPFYFFTFKTPDTTI